jgi:hypothetical protein
MLGDRSTGLRIVDLHLEGSLLTIDADVPTDRSSQIELQTSLKLTNASGAALKQIAPTEMELTFAATFGAPSSFRRAHATLKVAP